MKKIIILLSAFLWMLGSGRADTWWMEENFPLIAQSNIPCDSVLITVYDSGAIMHQIDSVKYTPTNLVSGTKYIYIDSVLTFSKSSSYVGAYTCIANFYSGGSLNGSAVEQFYTAWYDSMKADMSGLSTFDPSTDTVLHVRYVDSVQFVAKVDSIIEEFAANITQADKEQIAGLSAESVWTWQGAITLKDTLKLQGSASGLTAAQIWSYSTRKTTGGNIDTVWFVDTLPDWMVAKIAEIVNDTTEDRHNVMLASDSSKCKADVSNLDMAVSDLMGVDNRDMTNLYNNERGTDGAYTGTPPTTSEIDEVISDEAVEDSVHQLRLQIKALQDTSNEILTELGHDTTGQGDLHGKVDNFSSGAGTATIEKQNQMLALIGAVDDPPDTGTTLFGGQQWIADNAAASPFSTADKETLLDRTQAIKNYVDILPGTAPLNWSVSHTTDDNYDYLVNGPYSLHTLYDHERGTNSAALATYWTQTRAGYLDNINHSVPNGIDWTTARAGYLDMLGNEVNFTSDAELSQLEGSIKGSGNKDLTLVYNNERGTNNASTFDHTTDSTMTNNASRQASKADISGLSTFDPETDSVLAKNLEAATANLKPQLLVGCNPLYYPGDTVMISAVYVDTAWSYSWCDSIKFVIVKNGVTAKTSWTLMDTAVVTGSYTSKYGIPSGQDKVGEYQVMARAYLASLITPAQTVFSVRLRR